MGLIDVAVDLSTPYKRLILQLLGVLSFNIDSVVAPTWEFFEQNQLDSLLAQCQYDIGSGNKAVNVKRLHRLLMDELAMVQGSSTVAQRQLILREIQASYNGSYFLNTYLTLWMPWHWSVAAEHLSLKIYLTVFMFQCYIIYPESMF